METFNKIFERSKINKELLCFWKYNDNDGFWCGYVIDYNETLVKIQHYTKFGKPDGIIIAQIANIKSVDFDDDYTKAMQIVIDYSKELEKEDKINLNFSENEDWDFEIIKKLEGNFEIVSSVELNNSDYITGFIVEVTETDFVLRCVGKIGEDLGLVIYKLEDITGFRINDIDNRKRCLLYKWRKASL
ncbi:MAG: hypothetical protein Q8K02_14790 [Flavobacterium sp.]|nr:hypothetical protein [Flavobacterium sp.]